MQSQSTQSRIERFARKRRTVRHSAIAAGTLLFLFLLFWGGKTYYEEVIEPKQVVTDWLNALGKGDAHTVYILSDSPYRKRLTAAQNAQMLYALRGTLPQKLRVVQMVSEHTLPDERFGKMAFDPFQSAENGLVPGANFGINLNRYEDHRWHVSTELTLRSLFQHIRPGGDHVLEVVRHYLPPRHRQAQN